VGSVQRWLIFGIAVSLLAAAGWAVRPVASSAVESALPARARVAQVASDTVRGAPTGVPAPDTVPVTVHDSDSTASLALEVARTEAERETGLMNRSSLPVGGGMLFLFPYDSAIPFWMKDTQIPLDIAFIDSTARVVTIRHGVPFDLTPLGPTALYRYVIEVDDGWFAAHGLGVGATVDLPGGIPAAGVLARRASGPARRPMK
jgi:uncharacterized protein